MESNQGRANYNLAVGYPSPSGQHWRIGQRDGTGLFLMSLRDTLLCRIDQASGLMYFWDKKAGVEIPVDVRLLFPGKIGV